MNQLNKRLAALEVVCRTSTNHWHRIPRYESETKEQAVALYEVEHGPTDDGNGVVRVVISKPGERP